MSGKTLTAILLNQNNERNMIKVIQLALIIISTLAGFLFFFLVYSLVFDDATELSAKGALWLFGSFTVMVFPCIILIGLGNNKSKKLDTLVKNEKELDAPAKNSKSSTLGIVAVGLGLASIVMPYIAAIFFVPAAFICGIIAFRQGDRKFSGIAVALAFVGALGIVSVSKQIDTAQRDLERSLRSLDN